MSNVVEFPPADEPPALFIGPFKSYCVVVDGRIVPHLTGREHQNGGASLIVDNRFCGDFSTMADARQAAWLIAEAMAITAGYSHFGAESKDKPFAPKSVCISPPDPPQEHKE